MSRRFCVACLFLLFALLFSPLSVHADSFPIIGSLHSGRSPEALAVDTQTHILYIAHEGPGVVVAFDPVRGTVRWRVTLGDVATDIQVDSITHHVFVTATTYKQREASLYVLDGATGHILATFRTGLGDNGIALDAQRHIVYVSSGNGIDMFAVQAGWQHGPLQVTMTQLHIGKHPQGLGVNSRLGRLYVADVATSMLTVVDETTMRTIATVPVAKTPLQPLRVDEMNGRVYIACAAGQEVDVLDGMKNTMLARIPVVPYPEGIAVNTATGRIYVTNEGDDENGHGHDSGTTVTVIDGKSFDVLGTLRVGKAPDGVEADPTLRRVYVALERSDAVVEVSDSVNLPLQANTQLGQMLAAHNATTLVQQAAILTLLVMLVTIAWTTLAALSPRWRGRGSPRTPRADASSRSTLRSLPR